MQNNQYEDSVKDKFIISLSFEDGSIGTIQYFANGGSSFPKERIEVFCDNASLQIDNFKSMKGYNWNGFNKMSHFIQNKGQKDCADKFINSILKNEEPPIPYDEIFEVARVSIDLNENLNNL